MEDNPAPTGRTLMDATTFRANCSYYKMKKTYLCYQVAVQEGDKSPLVKKLQGFLRNESCATLGRSTGGSPDWKPVEVLVHRRELEPSHHAELCFLDRVRSWHLDEGKQYRLTWYMSWTPCPYCAPKLVEFLGENSHVSLRIFATRIHTKYHGYEDGLRNLRKAGAQLAIMTLKEHQHCWDTFVDNQGQPFEPWPNLVEHIQTESQELENILWNQGN